MQNALFQLNKSEKYKMTVCGCVHSIVLANGTPRETWQRRCDRGHHSSGLYACKQEMHSVTC